MRSAGPRAGSRSSTIKTTGDKVQDRPLAEIGGKALWTKELDRALLAGEVDFCVHSMKDVESIRPAEIHIAAVRPRGDVRDRIIGAESIEELKQGAMVGTSSPRRKAQLLRLRPDLNIVPIRGNVETRLRKVEAGEVDATLLAAAGLKRLEIDAGTAIPTEIILPAPGQAVIGMECRTNDTRTQSVLTTVNNQITYDCVMAERAFTRALGRDLLFAGRGLLRPRGRRPAHAGQLFSEDGSEMIEDRAVFDCGDRYPRRAGAITSRRRRRKRSGGCSRPNEAGSGPAPRAGRERHCEHARERGLDAIAIPLFEIEPVAWTVPEPGASTAAPRPAPTRFATAARA